MKFSPNNFLYLVKQLVTGGGKLSNSTLKSSDGGFNIDIPLSVGDAVLGSGTTLVADSQGLRALQNTNSSTNLTIGTWGFQVPRDYDQATDTFRIRVLAAMTGNTDTPVLTLASSTLLPAGTFSSDGKTLNLTNTLIAGSTATGSTVTAVSPLTISSTLSSTQAVYEFELSGQSLIRDQVVSLKLTTGSHTTDKVNVYGLSVVYASCLVAYNEMTLGNDPFDLGGNDPFGNPLRG